MSQQVQALVLDPKVDPKSPAIGRLQAEVRALAATRLPTLRSIFDVVQVEDRVVVLSEAFDARDLGKLLVEGLPLRALLDVMGEVATALDVAWNSVGPDGAPLHLVHHDIRPGTLLVGQHGDVRLGEFGLGRALSADMPGGEHSHWLYMAPERFAKGDNRSSGDIYSLGNVLYEGIVGRHPFQGKTFTELYPLMRDPALAEDWLADQLAQIPYDVPPGVEGLLARMLAVDPAGRPSAREVSRECDLLGDQVTGFPLKRWAKDRRWPAEISVPGEWVGRRLAALHIGAADAAGPSPSIAPPAVVAPAVAAPASAPPSIAPPSLQVSSSVAFDPFDAPSRPASLAPQAIVFPATPAAARPPVSPAVAPPPAASAPAPSAPGGFPSIPPAPPRVAPPSPPTPQVPPRPVPGPSPFQGFPSVPPALPRAPAVGLPRVPTPVAAPPRLIRAEAAPTEPTLGSGVTEPRIAGNNADPAVVPLESQLSSSWQRTLTPAPTRQRETGPSLRGTLDPELAFNRATTAAPALMREAAPPSQMTNVLLALAGFVVVLMIGLAVGGAFLMWGGAEPPAASPSLGEVIQPDGTRVSAVAEPAVAPPPEPEPEPAVEPEPKPESAPVPPSAPAPPADPGGNPRQLAKRGWDLVERQPGEAERIFRSALEKKPGFDDANYGLGYALLKQQQPGAAAPYLCQAMRGGDVEIQREVSALLRTNGLSCP